MKIKTMLALSCGTISTLSIGAIFMATAKISAKEKTGTKISDFENVIDSKGVPINYQESQIETRIAPFADLGSWHAFALPDYEHKAYWGGFTQPLIVRKLYPRSIAKSLDVVKVIEYDAKLVNGKYQFSGVGRARSLGKLPNNKVYIKRAPGVLWQEYEFDDFTLQLELRFVQNKTSFVKYNFINKTNKKKFFKLVWTGKLFPGARSNLGTQMIANGNHTRYLVEENGQFYKTKYSSYGQPLVNTSQFYPNAPKEGVLYLTFERKGLIAKTRRVNRINGRNVTRRATISIGKNGHPPDSNNKWYVISPRTKATGIVQDGIRAFSTRGRLYSNFHYQFLHFDFATNTIKSEDISNANWTNNPNRSLFGFIPDKNPKIGYQSQNSLKINFNRPYAPWNTNFLGHNDDWQWDMQWQKDIPMDIKVASDSQSYEAETINPFIINPDSSNSMFVGTSFTFTAQERYGFQYSKHGDNAGELIKGQLEVAGVALENKIVAQNLFSKSAKRWELYLDNLIGDDSKQNFNYQKVAVKAMETLTTNWLGNAGMLEHQGVTPSRSIFFFNEFWSWDTWKQAVAEVNFDPKLAIDNMRVMFDYQVTKNLQSRRFYNYSKVRQKNDIGMIPDLVAYEQSETNWRDTKPPLSAWAAYHILNTVMNVLNPSTIDPHTGLTYRQLAIDFGKYIYNRLIAYHLWWYSNRDGDDNGINEYGATIFDGRGNWTNNSKSTIKTATAWESGMDNAIRFDSYGANYKNDKLEDFDDGLEYTIKRNADGTVTGYVLQQESVDLNAYMYAEKGFIIKIGDLLTKLGVKYRQLQGSPLKITKDFTYKNLVKPGVIDRLEKLHSNKNANKYVQNLFKNYGKSYKEDAKSLANDMEYLKKYINDRMFDKKTGFFYDLKWKYKSDGKTRDVAKDRILSNRGAASEGLIPLWANAANSKNAKAARDFIMSPEGFNTYVPFPTAAYNNPRFEPDQYWRGPVWLDQAYFGVQGLNSNGFESDASYMANKLFNNAEGLLEDMPIYENYNPLTGKAINAKGFSWSAGMYLLMYKNYIKGGN